MRNKVDHTVMQTIGIVWDSNTRIPDPLLMSQLRTDPSVDPVTSILVSPSIPRLVTGPVWPEKTCSVRPFSNDHERAVQSVDPVMRMSLIFMRIQDAFEVLEDLADTDLWRSSCTTRTHVWGRRCAERVKLIIRFCIRLMYHKNHFVFISDAWKMWKKVK